MKRVGHWSSSGVEDALESLGRVARHRQKFAMGKRRGGKKCQGEGVISLKKEPEGGCGAK